jgi:hypothetical protein
MIAGIKKIRKWYDLAAVLVYSKRADIHYIYLFFLFISIFLYILNIMWSLMFNMLLYIYIQNIIDFDIFFAYYTDKYLITIIMYIMLLGFYFYFCKIFFIE